MHLLATLPRSGLHPVQRFYRCMVCKNIETVEVK